MKRLFKKTWFISTVIIGILLITFFINLWIMSLRLTAPYDDENLWYFAYNISDGGYLNIFAFSLMLVFYISILPILLSGYSFLKKNSWGFIVAVIYFLGFESTLIVFQSLNNYLLSICIIILNFFK